MGAKLGSHDGGASKDVALKIETTLPVTGNERQIAAQKKLEDDKALFNDLLLDLKLAKCTESVKVKGISMCILGEIYTQYAGVIGEWESKLLRNFQETFLEYLNDRLKTDVADQSDELVSGYLEAVRGLLSGSPREAAKCVYVCGCVCVWNACLFECVRFPFSVCMSGGCRCVHVCVCARCKIRHLCEQ